jgi:transforming growth factor-beta-induced protein
MRVIARCLMLPAVLLLGACSEDPVAPTGPNVVEVAQSVNRETGEFSTLLGAVGAAGLAEALAGDGQRTVFAPTDAAFAELGLSASNIDTVPTETLRDILLYHVANGRLLAISVVGASQLSMANGGTTRIRLEGGSAFVNDSRIVATDVEAFNGVIHVIDAVLMP